ncbi:MAG: PTS system mannose/fructose/sorbose family transporter subunit IID [Erysipelotrichaceae bacterium]|jgi:PTS system mannose-specific IID component|nr:PTS system mannose/fructose/sorbose family transporter subunit IID [Erysipelotrichaceae bacterium]
MSQVITKKDLNKIYWRLQFFGLGLTVNYVSAQAIGFATAIVPALKKVYKDADKDLKAKAMQRHLEYFLSQNTATGMILGITAALEENTTEAEKEGVVALKTGMMGPLAGIGDSVFKLTIQAIAGSIGAAYAIQGQFLGAILMFVIYNAINIAIKYYGIIIGYQRGAVFVTSGDQAKIMTYIINFATMVGVMVLGCLISSSVRLTIAKELIVQETVVPIQTLLDGAMPKLLPLLATIILYNVNKKLPRKYLIFVILGILFVGTLLSMWGFI